MKSAFRNPRTVARDTMAMLRAHPGRKFAASELAELVGQHVELVRRVLHARYHDGQYGLARDMLWGEQHRYWYIDPAAFAGSSNSRAVASYMAKHPRAARPSEIAAAVGLDAELVASVLEDFCREGAAVRCELVLRSGADHFEYRLARSRVSDPHRQYPVREELEVA